jgi:hypothetical protein
MRRICNPMSDDDDELSPHQFEALCLEEAKLRRKGVEVARRLRRAIKASREESRDLIKEHRVAAHQERRAEIEKHQQAREQNREDRRARMSPEVLAKMQDRIAGVREQTKEEIKQGERIEFVERKEKAAAMRGRIA